MGINYNHFRGSSCSNYGCNRVNNKGVIIAAIIALVLINILDDDTTNCVAEVLQAIGELMDVGMISGCLNHISNNCGNNCSNNCGNNYGNNYGSNCGNSCGNNNYY